MSGTPSSQIRNVALIGHGGSGKTTLAEALLFQSGAINRKGRVEDGTTVCDFEPEELNHHVSVSTAIAPITYGSFKINLLDTPGYVDFLPEVEMAIAVADLVVLVVSAVEGVEVQTRATWRLAERAGVPRIIFVNKLDRERADFERTLDALRSTFGSGIAPLELPIGQENAFRGVADLLDDVAVTYEDGKPTNGPIPEDIAPQEHRVRDNLIEGIVVADDQLMERYLEGDMPSPKELKITLAHGIESASVFPVICGSATRSIALDRLCDLICEITPHRSTQAHAGDQLIEIPADPSGEPVVRVVKTVLDPFVGKISVVQVLSGTIRPDLVLTNTRTKREERLHVLEMLRGKEAIALGEAQAGDVIAVPKLATAQVGDTLAPKSLPVVLDPLVFSKPLHSIAVRPKTAGDEDRLMTGLHRLQEEDVALGVRRDDETHQTILSGMGETHLNVVCERLKRKFNVEVAYEDLLVPYRETISTAAEAEGRHKKQSGGHGQFGVVHLRVEPLDRGEGFIFVDAVVGGAIPRQFIPAVEKGVVRAMRQGNTFGFPVVDVKVTCDDGKFHPVDSSEASFELAGALAFHEALAQASPIALEPIERIEVFVPLRYQGEALGDINSRRGRVLSSETASVDEQVIVALVPLSELTHYAVELRALSGGEGRFTSEFDHYAEVPAHLASSLPSTRTLRV
jgi:elongation factor G